MKDTYYLRQEVSNSDLSEVKKYFHPDFIDYDPEAAFRFGNLFDFLVTEPEKLDFLYKRMGDIQISDDEWEKAIEMRKALRKDHVWNNLIVKNKPNYQAIFEKNLQIVIGNFIFYLMTRCKYDFFFNYFGWGGDLKSTVATTQKQFEDAFWHFDYPRSRAWYMDISEAERDVVVGVSKKNYKVFKIFITRDTEYYKKGKEQYQDLAFQWLKMFENFKINTHEKI